MAKIVGAFHSNKNSGGSGLESEWNRNFRNNLKIPFHSTIPAWAQLLRGGIKFKMASQHSARRVCLSSKAYSSYLSMNDCSSRSDTKWYPSCEHGLASKRLACFSRPSKVTLGLVRKIC